MRIFSFTEPNFLTPWPHTSSISPKSVISSAVIYLLLTKDAQLWQCTFRFCTTILFYFLFSHIFVDEVPIFISSSSNNISVGVVVTGMVGRSIYQLLCVKVLYVIQSCMLFVYLELMTTGLNHLLPIYNSKHLNHICHKEFYTTHIPSGCFFFF